MTISILMSRTTSVSRRNLAACLGLHIIGTLKTRTSPSCAAYILLDGDSVLQKVHVNIPTRSRIFCISHRDDPDGLASAALVRCATGCRFVLTGYEHIDKVLSDVPRSLDWLVVTDLGLDERREMINRFPAIARKILYVDHHMLSAKTKRLLQEVGVIVRHSLKDCTSVLVWDLLRSRLPRGAINLAAYGAVTDPPASGRLTREVLLKTSWNLDQYEGHLLALALSSDTCTTNLREQIVKRLASLRMPHQIGLVRNFADYQATKMPEIQKQLYDRAQVKRRVAIAQAGKLALGTSAELLLGVADVIASIVYGSTRHPSNTRVSVRGTDECALHLGKVIQKIARRIGGTGGGHKLAAGGMFPSSRLREFLSLFVREVGQ